jgi:hypothetical protein
VTEGNAALADAPGDINAEPDGQGLDLQDQIGQSR